MQRKSDPAGSVSRAVYFIIILFAFFAVFNAVPSYLYLTSAISLDTLNFLFTAAMSLSFSAAAITYLKFVERGRKGVAQRLGLGARALTASSIGFGLFLFLIIFSLEVLTGLVSSTTGTAISTNVSLVFAGAPVWFLIFAAVVAPINEEILFRGLMVPRLGIFASALIFAIPHLTYDSTFAIEFIAAFIFGILAGYVFKRTGSLYSSITAHMLVNTLSIISTFALLAWVL